METNITFSSENLLLEGLLKRVPGEMGVVITHPHSLYGGDMYNPVVLKIQQVYAMHGYTTLRFNFRGVGNSSGQFGNGCGEQKDVLAAIDYLCSSGIASLHLAGYSFGSRVLAGIEMLPDQVDAQLYVAPPVALMDFSTINNIEHLKLVVAADLDDIAPVDQIRHQIGSWNQRAALEVVEKCDHSFNSAMAELEEKLHKIFICDEHSAGK